MTKSGNDLCACGHSRAAHNDECNASAPRRTHACECTEFDLDPVANAIARRSFALVTNPTPAERAAELSDEITPLVDLIAEHFDEGTVEAAAHTAIRAVLAREIAAAERRGLERAAEIVDRMRSDRRLSRLTPVDVLDYVTDEIRAAIAPVSK